MALASLFEFQLANDDPSFWSVLGDFVGPAAIVFAAVLAARWATKNVGRELEAADLRTQKELRHQQAIREREAARQTLDEVTNIAIDGVDALVDLGAAIMTAETTMREARELPEETEEREIADEHAAGRLAAIGENVRTAHRLVRKITPARVRLRLRFRDDHPVTETYISLAEAIKGSELNERKFDDEPRGEEAMSEARELRFAVNAALEAFVKAGRDWIEAPVDP